MLIFLNEKNLLQKFARNFAILILAKELIVWTEICFFSSKINLIFFWNVV